MKTLVPPIKCQGIKTKIVPTIRLSVPSNIQGKWIEPFCGSCVVALNLQPKRALLADTNKHIISFYQKVQDNRITPGMVREYLTVAGSKLKQDGESFYYLVRERFNKENDGLDFLFLNRACFNGVMRFNRQGNFNVPFCRKPERFSQAYITKIVNQVKNIALVSQLYDWEFVVGDFRYTLACATENDFVYLDPPYTGRHVDYYNSWNAEDEISLAELLRNNSFRFLLSTWHSNKYRNNTNFEALWQHESYFLKTQQHFYHVGATEILRNSMLEALVSNYSV